jgi:hypothetical protein
MVNMTSFNITEKCGFGAYFQSLMAQGTNFIEKGATHRSIFRPLPIAYLLSGNRNASGEKTTAKLKDK